MEAVSFLQSIPWYAWIAIVAIVCGFITKLVAMNQQHAERMAAIQAGMNPDAKPPAMEEL
ncbi:MAG TPA: hypothetical protein VGZ22_14990 [Isosphaeraceae bacterium]|jgi:hypothetical protein|nr:hypothetical protein [Isosphaeraceae bacterium]